jgi:hypothetical protein
LPDRNGESVCSLAESTFGIGKMTDPSPRTLRQPSWWAEGVQFARWDPFGFGVLTMPLLLFVMPLHWVPQAWVLCWTVMALVKGGELFHLPARRGRAEPVLVLVF